MTITTVDAFSGRPFEGNPAAVCLLDASAPDEWMQALAAEMNLSETAFLVPEGDAFRLRWFTPAVEVDLCGHATLASAHVLYEGGRLAPDAEARFDTRSGRLVVRADGGRTYTMDFPATPPEAAPAPDGLADAFGVTPAWTGRTPFDLFAVLDSEAAVRALAPSPSAVAALGSRGIIMTARAEEGQPYDVVSRFFAPSAGIPEDPVTGSAHCAIGPYWAGRLGSDAVACYQASARGGHVGVRVAGDRVALTGRAVTVYRADLTEEALPFS